jgi:ferritin-like metal-binding protein YciE
MPEVNARDAKLIQYLNEAYGKERQLETALTAHIAMTTRPPYKRRLQAHLKETKRHAKDVERRIKQLGGVAETVDAPGPAAIAELAQGALSAGQKAAAAAQGPLHMLRGTGEQEKLLKNAKTEYADEAQEIATYLGIEALAEAVGDRDTARLARAIRRDEERMAAFLAKEISRLTRAVATAEIPAAQRRRPRRRARQARSGARPSARTTS